LYHNRENRV